MTDRVPGAPGQYKAVITEAELQKMQTGEQFVISMTRDDHPIVEGTPYSKATVLPDELAQKLCPEIVDPTPADAFGALLPVAGIELNSDTNFDKLQRNIIAFVNPYKGNNTGVHVPPKAGFIHCFFYSNGSQEVQRLYGNDGIMLFRVKGGEWEYENPPMESGVEYRTTERYDGNAVYTKLVDLGAWVNDGTAEIGVASTNTSKIIRYSGIVGHSALPTLVDLNLAASWSAFMTVTADSTNTKYVANMNGGESWKGYPTKVVVHYLK